MIGIAVLGLVQSASAPARVRSTPAPKPTGERSWTLQLAQTVDSVSDRVAFRYVRPVEMRDAIAVALRDNERCVVLIFVRPQADPPREPTGGSRPPLAKKRPGSFNTPVTHPGALS
jgi:hypothetical protein